MSECGRESGMGNRESSERVTALGDSGLGIRDSLGTPSDLGEVASKAALRSPLLVGEGPGVRVRAEPALKTRDKPALSNPESPIPNPGPQDPIFRAEHFPDPAEAQSPLSPRGRGVGGEGAGLPRDRPLSPTPLPQGERGSKADALKNRSRDSSPAAAPLYPLFLNLADRPVLVVGGGEVAARKVLPLIECGAVVRVGAPALNEALQALKDQGRIEHLQGEFDPTWLDEVFLAIAATDDARVNRRVAEEGAARKLWVNVVDDTELTRVQVPAIVRRGPLTVAIGSGGAAPVLARQLREKVEQSIDESLGPLAELLRALRPRIRARFPNVPARRKFMETLWPGEIGDLLRAQRTDEARTRLIELIEAGEPEGSRQGFVSLVGAGPGDPGLLTLKGQRRLQEADVILHDRLVSRAVLELARRDAQFIEVAKEAGTHHTTQDGIHALLLQHAQQGKRVVRLKGGDPFIFGRGGEELEFLRAHGIAYEVVPGITAALACAAHAGIPLTHREHAQSVRFVTAHCRNSIDALDWRALAQEKQTLAVYMGVSGLDTLRQRLMAHGRSGDTPAALIENGSRPEQRVIHCDLATLPDVAKRESVKSPALLILGEVAALGKSLAWFGVGASAEATPAEGTRTAPKLQLDMRA
jgi:uroporphyrin-III C-methyltransferase / precorrin-2 dehydrogenase / sirohydrochlorin ferrochelatase